ncbi:MAG: NAD(P)H-binding protein [Sedimenticola sp.]|jgi:putative NADH-flavin reductase|nr:NAD(P)H-binding protein [Sedimenticola sp.]
MKITVLGAAGNVGRRIVNEALSRGHEVTAVVRSADRIHELSPAAIGQTGDASNIHDIVRLSTGQDLVVNATRSVTSNAEEVVIVTETIMEGLASTGVRLLIVGGAASLTVPGANGKKVIDDPQFLAPSLRHIGEASVAQYDACRGEMRVDWSYLSPPADLKPGKRTGQYRLGGDEMVVDSQGTSTLSIEDLAVVVLDEAETPRHHQTRFTAAY